MSVLSAPPPTYSAVVRRDGDWWIGWIAEVRGVNCQAETREQLLEDLREALAEVLDLNRELAKREAGADYEEVAVSL